MSSVMGAFHPFYENDEHVVAMSHAGDTSTGAKGGTVDAYRAAHDLGYRYFQIDVIKIGGDELVSGHAIIGRKFSWEDKSVDQLRAEGHHVDRVRDIVEAIPDGRWNLEIKSQAAEPGLAAFLRTQDKREARFGVSAPFNRKTLKRLRNEFGSGLCTNASLVEGSLFGVALVGRQTRDPAAFQVFFPLIRSARVIERCKAKGVQFQAWPVNSRSQIERVLDLGVRGVITDDHLLLRDVLIERGEWSHEFA